MDIDSPISNPGNDPTAELSSGIAHGSGALYLPTFSSSFPLPFRVLALIGFAILLWAVNLHVLSALGVDTSWALEIGEEVGVDGGIDEADAGDGESGVRTRLLDDGQDDVESGTIPATSSGNLEPQLPSMILLDTPPGSTTPTDPPSPFHIPPSPTLKVANSRPHPGVYLHRASPRSLYTPVYRLFAIYVLWVGSGWLLFSFITRVPAHSTSDIPSLLLSLEGQTAIPIDDDAGVETMEDLMLANQVKAQRNAMESGGVRLLITLIMLGAAAGIVAPWRGVGNRHRRAFLKSFHRILRPRLSRPPYFSDVILADILTSFAKVLGDLLVSGHQLWGGGISKGRVRLEGLGNIIVLGMVCLPYLLRFQQCVYEYLNPQNTSSRPLLNALKYASAFPVIILSAMQRNVIKEVALMKGKTVAELTGGGRWFGEHRLFRLWLLAVIVNSMYSFYWDVTNDWGLCLLTPSTWAKQPLIQAGLGLPVETSPRIHIRSSSAGGSRIPIRPMILTRLVQNLLRPLGLDQDSSAQSPSQGYSGHHQRSPYPSPGLHGRMGSASSGVVSLNMGELSGHSKQSPEISYPPSSHIGGPYSTSITTSSRPLYSNRYITIPNPLYLGLRSTLLFPDPLVYHLFICIDLVLRFIWSLKLSSHLHTISEIESGVFLMEALELMRRWMWVFLRVEWEVVKKMESRRVADRSMSIGEVRRGGDGTGGVAARGSSEGLAGMSGDVLLPTSPRRRSGGKAPALPLDLDELGLDR